MEPIRMKELIETNGWKEDVKMILWFRRNEYKPGTVEGALACESVKNILVYDWMENEDEDGNEIVSILHWSNGEKTYRKPEPDLIPVYGENGNFRYEIEREDALFEIKEAKKDIGESLEKACDRLFEAIFNAESLNIDYKAIGPIFTSEELETLRRIETEISVFRFQMEKGMKK